MTPETIGKFRVIREVGKGATATVYLCESDDHPEGVAVKLIQFGDKNKDEGKWTRRQMKLLTTESAIAKRLDHPNIIKFYDVVVEETRAYIVMEFVDGQPLDQFCSFDRMLPIHRTVSIVFKCCLALDYAYRQGIVHRDIKPANIMFDAPSGELKITDFGIARLTDSNRTRTGVVLGTPSFMSPEQLQGRVVTGSSDLFSLAVTLYQLLTAQLPFRADSMPGLMLKIAQEPHVPARLVNPALPAGVDAFLDRALAKQPADRYPSGAAFALALRALNSPGRS